MKYKDFLEINNIKLMIVGDKKEIVYFGTKDEENTIYIEDYFKDIKAQIFKIFRIYDYYYISFLYNSILN